MEKRTYLDRRTGEDRRKVYSLDYFTAGGVERRQQTDRRKSRSERRMGWVRVEGMWSSVYVGQYQFPINS